MSSLPAPLAALLKDELGALTYTDHGSERAAQRNLGEADLRYVLQHGSLVVRTGVTFITLCRADIPSADLRLSRISRLEGTTILLSHDGFAITTVYRNKRSLKAVRRKSKNRRRVEAPAPHPVALVAFPSLSWPWSPDQQALAQEAFVSAA